MSGGLFTNQLARETGAPLDEAWLARLSAAHAEAYRGMGAKIRPLPGARELLAYLSEKAIPWAIATSGRMETAGVNLRALGVDPRTSVVVTRDQVAHAKPDPDLFLAAAARLGAPIENDLRDRRCHLGHAGGGARALGIGLLSGAMASASCNRPRRCGSTRTPPICWRISTSLAAAVKAIASAPAATLRLPPSFTSELAHLDRT